MTDQTTDQLVLSAERAKERIRELASLFDVCDGGQYLNDWIEKKQMIDQCFERLESDLGTHRWAIDRIRDCIASGSLDTDEIDRLALSAQQLYPA